MGVHTTQFAIRDPQIGLYEPLLKFARECFDEADADGEEPLVRVAGICGTHRSGRGRGVPGPGSRLSRRPIEPGCHARRRSGHADRTLPERGRGDSRLRLLSVGKRGRVRLAVRLLAKIRRDRECGRRENRRLQSLSNHRRGTRLGRIGRREIALYTGNDDNIVMDWSRPYRFVVDGQIVERRFVGGLLGHWAVWTSKAVDLLAAKPRSDSLGRAHPRRHDRRKRLRYRCQRGLVRRGQRVRRRHRRRA